MKPIKPRRAVDLITEHLRSAILTGKYPIGSRLPAERKLAESLEVNRLTLRAALSHLEAEGLVIPKHGQGVLVLNFKKTASIDLIAHIKDPEVLQDVFSLRKILAAEAVAGACNHATINDVNRLRTISKQQELTDDISSFIEGDLQFMKALVSSSDNLALQLLFNSFEKITRYNPKISMKLLANKSQARSSYKALLALIRNRDPDLARKAILGYLTNEDQEVFARVLSAR
jgi:GntR family transcriptional regulator, transcriptional repressor for pyruvate dehydrogenase complex